MEHFSLKIVKAVETVKTSPSVQRAFDYVKEHLEETIRDQKINHVPSISYSITFHTFRNKIQTCLERPYISISKRYFQIGRASCRERV